MTSPRKHHLADNPCRNSLEFMYYTVMSDLEERGCSEYTISVDPHPKHDGGVVVTAVGARDNDGKELIARASAEADIGEPVKNASLEYIIEHIQATPQFPTLSDLRRNNSNG